MGRSVTARHIPAGMALASLVILGAGALVVLGWAMRLLGVRR